MLFAIVFIVIFLLMVNSIEQLVTVKGAEDFGIKAVLLFFFILAFIAIFWLKNSVATRGIKSFMLEFNNHLSKSVFTSSFNWGKQSEGLISSLSNAGQKFGNAVVKLVSDSTFYGILFIAAFIYVSIHLVLAGVFIFVSSGALIVFVCLLVKK